MSHEPDDQEVEQFIAEHPSGAAFHEIAAFLGITHQRVQQIVLRAVGKLQRELRWRKIYRVEDAVGDQFNGAYRAE